MEINQNSVEIINTGDDGYIIRYKFIDASPEGKEIWNETLSVVEASDNDKDSMCKMLYKVAELFGEAYNKYSNENLSITFDKVGHRYESNEEKDDGKKN